MNSEMPIKIQCKNAKSQVFIWFPESKLLKINPRKDHFYQTFCCSDSALFQQLLS